MIKVDNFFGCCTLETGGLIIGWIGLIGNALGFIFCLIAAVLLIAYNCQDYNDFIARHDGGHFTRSELDACDTGRGIIIVGIIILALLSIGIAWISYCLIKGSSNRDHVRVKPMMIVMAVIAVISFLGILSFTVSGVITALIWGAIYGYCFIVLFSLYEMLREEHERGLNTQYQAPETKA